MYLGVRDADNDGIVAEYSGYIDGEANYTLKYRSPWMDLGNEQEGVIGTRYLSKQQSPQ